MNDQRQWQSPSSSFSDSEEISDDATESNAIQSNGSEFSVDSEHGDTLTAWDQLLDACRTGALDQAKTLLTRPPEGTEGTLDINAVKRWSATDIEAQCARDGLGWFREHTVFRPCYGQGHHVIYKPEVVKRDLSSEREFLRCTSGLHWTALHEAVLYGHLSLVQLLLAYGADACARNCGGQLPLHLAAQHGCLPIVSALLQHETVSESSRAAQLAATDAGGNTPLHLVLYKLLAQNKVAQRRCRCRWATARESGNGHLAVLRMLWDMNQQHTADMLPDCWGHSVAELEVLVLGDLFEACAEGDEERARELLCDRAEDPNMQMAVLHRTPLHEACEHGHANVASLLLNQGADAFVQDSSGQTALHVCARLGRENVARNILRSFGVASTIESSELVAAYCAVRDRTGRTALLRAIESDRFGMALLLIPHSSLRVHDNCGLTPLHVAAAKGNTQMILALVAGAGTAAESLLDQQEYVCTESLAQDRRDAPWLHGLSAEERRAMLWGTECARNSRHRRRVQGMTPLHAAIRGGCRSRPAVNALLQLGADVNTLDKSDADPRTSLELAASRNDMDLVRQLLAHGATVPCDGCLILHRAVYTELISDTHPDYPFEFISTIVARCPQLLNQSLPFPLATPRFAGREQVIAPLRVSLICHHMRVASLFIAAGADVNAVDASGRSNLYYAACDGCADVVSFLLRNGAGGLTVPHSVRTQRRPSQRRPSYGKMQVASDLRQDNATAALYAALDPSGTPAAESLALPILDQNSAPSYPRSRQAERQQRERECCVRALVDTVGGIACLVGRRGSQLCCLQLALCRGYWTAASQMLRLSSSAAPEFKENNMHPLVLAARAPCMQHFILLSLLQRATVSTRTTAIVVSARLGRCATLKLLLGLSNDENAPDLPSLPGTALQKALCCASKHCHVDCIRCLLVAGATITDTDECGLHPGVLAARAGSWDAIEMFRLQAGDKGLVVFNDGTLLLEATRVGHTEVARLLLRALRSTGLWEGVQRHMLSRLVRATACSGVQLLSEFLDPLPLSTASILDDTDEYGVSALRYARAQGHHEVAAALIKFGAKPIVAKYPRGVFRAIMSAHEKGSSPRRLRGAIRNLHKMFSSTRQNGLGVRAVQRRRDNTLFWAYGSAVFSDLSIAAMHSSHAFVSCLAACGIDLTQKSKNNGRTPMLAAARCGNVFAIKVLLNAGVPVDQDAIMESVRAGQFNCASWLLNNNFPIGRLQGRRDGTTVLHVLASHWDEQGATHFANRVLQCPDASIDVRDETGMTPVAVACAAGRAHLAAFFLSRGALMRLEDASHGFGELSNIMDLCPGSKHVHELGSKLRDLREARSSILQLDSEFL